MNNKMFLVAIGGETKDGRYLSNEDILAIAKNYSHEIFTARIAYEFSDALSNLGTVKALRAEMVEGRAYLYAEVSISNVLIQKAKEWASPHYFAISINCNSESALPNPYLFGLSTTTNPAIEGTEIITLSDLVRCGL